MGNSISSSSQKASAVDTASAIFTEENTLMKEGSVVTLKNNFFKLFSELEHCTERVQKQKVLEMNGIMFQLHDDDLKSIFTVELFTGIFNMLKDKKKSFLNALLLLKYVGFWKVMKGISLDFTNKSLLKELKKMIIKEKDMKEKRNEKLLTDLCECIMMIFYQSLTGELHALSVSLLLKVALKKGNDKKTREEVEMALLALNGISKPLEQKYYLNEITDIIQYHQEHHNLTCLANQSAFHFLISRFKEDDSLKEVVLQKMHFVSEATKELDELNGSLNWDTHEKNFSEKMRVRIITRWLYLIFNTFRKEFNEIYGEVVELTACVSRVYALAKDYEMKIRKKCINLFYRIKITIGEDIFILAESGAANIVLERMCRPILDDNQTAKSKEILLSLSERLYKKKTDLKIDKKSWQMKKRAMFEMLEEEGYEDIITSFHEVM
ncbi:uncharacterized protein MONOS_17230 [Monocercomonoides exilis]|uniref:uncharacterized protein n=1 Tax=Monocercomonoides exilis TaxID=2049356 RepID=UPI00355A4928|nr:hypothetical protein MONOS_17230 [Monocercomonoides exilis]